MLVAATEAGSRLHAQSQSQPHSQQEPRVWRSEKTLPQTELNHSLALSILGVQYAFELPVDRIATLIVRPGMQFGYTHGSGFYGGSDLFYAILPTIDVEPRIYYNLDNRARRGKRMEGNQGNYFSLLIKNVLPFPVASDVEGDRIVGATLVTPMWGMRRVWGGHWLFELGGGVGLQFPWASRASLGWDGNGHGDGPFEFGRIYPNINVRFGYSF